MSVVSCEELTGAQRMELLCESFPILRGAPGTSPWDQEQFARWGSRGGHLTPATRQAVAFVLAVWNGGSNGGKAWFHSRRQGFGVAVFDVVEAMSRWDDQQQAAFHALRASRLNH